MFGINKKKTIKKSVRKVSSGVNRKAVKKKPKSKVSKKNVEAVTQHHGRTPREKISLQGAGTIVKPKKGALKIGNKSFNSPDEISAYYRAEGERVKKAMKQFKIDAAESYLGVAKGDLMKVLSQKKKLGAIAVDLEDHKAVLDKKIGDLNSQKEKSESHKISIRKFIDKMKGLEDETKRLLDAKEELIRHEDELIKEMKTMAKLAQRDLDLTDVATANELANFEISKEAVLVEAKHLLSEEANKLFADNVLLDRLDEKAIKRLSELNNQLAEIHGARKETLKKRHVLEISEKETADELASATTKVKSLEEKYQKLLKK